MSSQWKRGHLLLLTTYLRGEACAQRGEARSAASGLGHLLLQLELGLQSLGVLEPLHLVAHLLRTPVVEPLELRLALALLAQG